MEQLGQTAPSTRRSRRSCWEAQGHTPLMRTRSRRFREPSRILKSLFSISPIFRSPLRWKLQQGRCCVVSSRLVGTLALQGSLASFQISLGFFWFFFCMEFIIIPSRQVFQITRYVASSPPYPSVGLRHSDRQQLHRAT